MGVQFVNDIRIHAMDGSNLVTDEGCKRLVEICRASLERHQVIVFSPVGTGQLEIDSLLSLAKGHDERLWSMLEKRCGEWDRLASRLLAPPSSDLVLQKIKAGFADIEDLLRAVWLVEDISAGSKRYIDLVIGSWISEILCQYVSVLGLDASYRDFATAQTLSSVDEDLLFVSGVFPSAASQEYVTEYGASLLAASLKAKGLTIWNNDHLLRNADIREVPSAKVIASLSYAEATELSYFGAPLIHPQALLPAIEASVDVRIRCWNEIGASGTVISKHGEKSEGNRVKGFSIIHDVALVNVEGAGMSGVIGIASRLFSAMRKAYISVILISQASSEHSICFAVPEKQMVLAVETARAAFSAELSDHSIQSIEGEAGCAILAAVGQQMTGQAGVSGKFFSSLGKAGVNVRAIAQGSSEKNISVVIKGSDAKKALRALHAGFFLSKQALSVGLFGPGNIGGTLLDQISSETVRLKEQFGVDIHVRGIANSRRMLLDEEGIDLSSWKERFSAEAVDLNMEQFVNHIGATYFPHSLLIDCTTSSTMAEKYVHWLEQGIHIITPNKKAGTTPYPYYRSIFDTCLRTGRRFLYETTVGAGLPIICTLKDLVQTGDRVHRIEGIVSGTLAWLFNKYDGTVPFSTLVRQAKEMGYSEPDPRDDLSGMDVGRKAVILARELGFAVEVADIPIQSLVPPSLQDATSTEFMSRLEEIDGPMLDLFEQAAAKGEHLRYVASVADDGSCSAALRSFPSDHPFSQATGTDNVICYTTDRYLAQPLVIKGPGAGREVTAGGVFADMLRLAAYLGARI
jgi:aspartokinase/homoserine dehydrogenase 1